ncbi:MAG: glycosyltransferase [Chitinophagales bacterium]
MYNIVIIGTSCFDGMASSKRVMNLMTPLLLKKMVTLNNLIYEKDIKQRLDKKGNLDGINFRVIGFRSKNILTVFSFVFKGVAFLKKSRSREQKNIIYNYGSIDIKNLIFLLYGKLAGYKILIDIVEDNRYEKSVTPINKFRIRSSQFLLKNLWKLANSIIVISNHLYKRMQDITKGKRPLYLIPICVDLKHFKNPGTIPRNDHLTIFYGGSFGEKDGLEYLIEAFEEVGKRYKNVDLILTGIGHKSNMDRIALQIDQLKNKDRIILKGFLTADNYFKLLNDSDIFCMTRVNSKFANAGFPFKLGEFLASGKAVIATSVGDVPKYLFNNVNSLVIAPNSVTEIVGALSSLIEDPGKIQSLGVEARKTAEQYFDSEKISMQLFRIFESLYEKKLA